MNVQFFNWPKNRIPCNSRWFAHFGFWWNPMSNPLEFTPKYQNMSLRFYLVAFCHILSYMWPYSMVLKQSWMYCWRQKKILSYFSLFLRLYIFLCRSSCVPLSLSLSLSLCHSPSFFTLSRHPLSLPSLFSLSHHRLFALFHVKFAELLE